MTKLISYKLLLPNTNYFDFFGILLFSTIHNSYTIYHFTIELAIFLNITSVAYKLIVEYYQLKNNMYNIKYAEIEKTIIEAIATKISKDDLIAFLLTIIGDEEQEKFINLANHYYDILAGKWTIYKCSDCSFCNLIECCYFSKLDIIRKKINYYKNNIESNDCYFNIFCQQISSFETYKKI